MKDRLFVLLQRLLPRYLLTRIVYAVTRIRVPVIKDFLIRRFVSAFKVDLDGVKAPVPEGFATFNDFFVRELDEAARPVDASARSLVSPVDGTVSAAGTIDGSTVFQAKGLDYSLEDLLAMDLDRARALQDGSFATIYLAPYNYHRVHAPFAGRLDALHYVPGDLYSVNEATVRHLPGLFRRNERLVTHFATDFGPAALIFVGALNVGSISTPWTGELRPRKAGSAELIATDPAVIAKGELLGWFNMGSTVILLLPPGAATWDAGVETGKTVRMGERIGTRIGEPSS